MVRTITSGCQTGADQAGLRAARALEIDTTGYVTRGCRTEDGPRPDLRDLYNLIELESYDYKERTRRNVAMADGTVIFGKRSIGSNTTEELCRIMGKPCCWVYLPKEHRTPTIRVHAIPASFRLWLALHKVQVLNVAGNRESRNPGIGKLTEQFLMEALK